MKPALIKVARARLLAGLRHTDSFVRCESARLLGALRVRWAVPALTRLLQTDAYTTKVTAVYALGDIGDRRAAPILRKICDDPGVFRFPGMHDHDMIRLAAAYELARWNDSTGVQAVRDLLYLPNLEAMLQLGPSILAAKPTPALHPLKSYITLAQIQAHHGRLSASAHFLVSQCLAHIHEPAATKSLIAMLTHFSRYVRPEAACALMTNDPSPAHIRRIARQARVERSPFARIRFAAMLHRLGHSDGSAVVAKELRSRDPFLRATAVDAAAQAKLTTLAPVVIKLLDDTDFYVRICAAEAVETLARSQAAALLTPLLADPHPRVAIQAAKSLLVCSTR